MQTWDMLAKLPTNKELETGITSFHTACQQPKWEELIDPTSAFALLYSLRIVKAALERDRETVCLFLSCFVFVKHGLAAPLPLYQ